MSLWPGQGQCDFKQIQTHFARLSISESDSLLKAWCELTHPKSQQWSLCPAGSQVNRCSLDKNNSNSITIDLAVINDLEMLIDLLSRQCIMQHS